MNGVSVLWLLRRCGPLKHTYWDWTRSILSWQDFCLFPVWHYHSLKEGIFTQSPAPHTPTRLPLHMHTQSESASHLLHGRGFYCASMSKRHNDSSCKYEPSPLWDLGPWADYVQLMKEVCSRLLPQGLGAPWQYFKTASAFMEALRSTRADPDHSKDVDQFTQINYSYEKMTGSAYFISPCQPHNVDAP